MTKNCKKIKDARESFSKTEQLLCSLKMFDKKPFWGKINFSFSKFSQEFTDAMHNADYDTIYRIARSNMDYDLLLVDGSFFQFTITDDKSRFAYYQTPKKNISLQDFIDISRSEDGEHITKDEWQDDFENNYEQFVDEAESRQFVTPIRYDFDPETHNKFKNGTNDHKLKNDTNNHKFKYHATAHMHIGFEQTMRIPLHCTLSPLNFVVFVLRMMYFDSFVVGIQRDDIKHLLTKENGNEICGDDFTPEEEMQLYLF